MLSLPLTLLLTLLPQAQAAPGPHDNVLVIVADDMGVERPPAYGLNVVPAGPAPWLDALAAHGVLFRNAYSEPLCSPTRSAILTGKHPYRTGIGRGVAWNGSAGDVEGALGETSLADALGPTHRTHAIGKWHLTYRKDLGGTGFQHPVLYGFDEHRGPIANLNSFDPTAFQDFEKNLADASGHQQVQVSGRYATSDQVDDALDAIERAGEDPWFVWLAFNAPHSPFHVPPADLITLDVDTASTDSLKHRAAIEAMDTEIGRLLLSIRPAVLARTWIIFVGDNGSPAVTLDGISVAKGSSTEFGTHVPLIVAGPRVVAPGREVDALVGVTDLFATVCEMARVPTPVTAVDSVSFFDHLLDPEAPARRLSVLSELFRPNGPGPYTTHDRSIRDTRFRLRVRVPAIPTTTFFHLPTDPFGNVNLLPGLSRQEQAVFDSLSAQLDELQP